MIARMARRLALAAIGGLLVFAAPAQAGITADQALTILNQIRASTGIPAVQAMDASKNDGCAKHNHYMALNGGQLTHTEMNGNPGYTPEGADAGSKSVLAEPEGTPQIWLDSVYHRVGILQPRLSHSGFAASEGFTCMWTIEDVTNNTVPTVKTYPWPPNGATNIPTRFTSNESPDPHDLVPGDLGYLLSVDMDGPWYDHYSTEVKVGSASLVSAGGTHVQLTVVDSQTNYQYNGLQIGRYLPSAFALFPHGALHQATTYTAHAQGVVTYQSSNYPFSVTWHFKTAGTPVPGKATLHFGKGKLKGKKVKFPLTASSSLVGRRATISVNGKKKTTITLKGSQTVKVKRPAKGKTVKVHASTAAFTIDGVSYPAASASKKFKRKS